MHRSEENVALHEGLHPLRRCNSAPLHIPPGSQTTLLTSAHNMASYSNERFLIFGEGGWIAGLLADLLNAQGKNVATTNARMEDVHSVKRALSEHRPNRVINCAGKTGRPNVDWCEDNRAATVRSNVIGTLMLADICASQGIHCTVLATGCTFNVIPP